MKKNIIYISILIIFIAVLSIGLNAFLNKKNNKDSTIKVAEVTHSVFYTPFYVAIENGYFKEQGINIDLMLVSGSDNVAAAVLSNDVAVGLAGPESVVYVYLGGEKDYLTVFSGLTKRDGQFILSKKDEEFKWDNLIGKEILVGRKSGMPAMCFFKALENKGISKSDIKINTSVEFAELAGSFIGSNANYVNLFEPLATSLENNKQGYVVESIGLASNEFPYTAFYTRKSFLDNNKVLLKKFTNAINKGLNFTMNNNSLDVANVIKKQFVDTNVDDLKEMIDRYKKADVWLSTPFIPEDFYNTLIELLKENDLIKDNAEYKYLIHNLYE